MGEFDFENVIDFTNKIYKQNKQDAYKYLIGKYEENKNYIEDRQHLKILLLLIDLQQQTNSQEDISYFFKKALEYAIKFNDNESIIVLYRYYCQLLYKNAKLDKCETLIGNFITNFDKFSSFQNSIKIKEIEIAISSLLKEEIKDKDDFFELLNEEMDPIQIIKMIVSYSRKYISSMNEEDILKLIEIFRLGLQYIFKNRNHFKIFHHAFSELHNLLGNLYYYFGLFSKAKRHFIRAFLESLSKPDINMFAKFQKNISISLYEIGQIDKANKYFEIIEKLYNKIEDPVVLNQFYSVLGLSCIREGKYSLGHSLLKSAIKYRMSIKDYFTLLHTLNYAIIFCLHRNLKEAYNYFLYFEKIVIQLPNSYYYLYYILYLSIFKKQKFNSLLFVQKLLLFPIYSLRIIPLFSLCLKYKLPITKNQKFCDIMYLFKKSFKSELTDKDYDNFSNQFDEYEDILNLKSKNYLLIKDIKSFNRNRNMFILDWKKFMNSSIYKLNEKTLIDLLFLKLLDNNTIVEYKNKKYILNHIYKYDIESNLLNWTRKTLFNRIYLERIALIPIE